MDEQVAKRRPARPDGPHRRDLLVHPRPAPAHVAADREVVVLTATDAHADGESAVAEPVDRGEVLRRVHGIVRREDHDRRPEPDAFGQRGRRGQLHDPRMARVGDPFGYGEACERPLVDGFAPGKDVAPVVRQHRRQGHRDLHQRIPLVVTGSWAG
jgi:hypothetical protein